MFSALKRWWKYLGARVSKSFDDRADPAVQLEQAMKEAQDQHRQLREQAANVIANQKQLELRLGRSLEEYERVTTNTRQAVIMAEEARGAGNEAKAIEYSRAAESFAERMVNLEQSIEEDKQLALSAAQAAEQAKAAVDQNGAALQRKLAERQQLLSQLDQAKMQEQLNSAMESLSSTVDADVPSIDQVRTKIEARYAKAKGMTELSGQEVETSMLEVEAASRNAEALARLSEIKGQLGITTGDGASPGEVTSGGTQEPAASEQPTSD
jgi:phage shock protein A